MIQDVDALVTLNTDFEDILAHHVPGNRQSSGRRLGPRLEGGLARAAQRELMPTWSRFRDSGSLPLLSRWETFDQTSYRARCCRKLPTWAAAPPGHAINAADHRSPVPRGGYLRIGVHACRRARPFRRWPPPLLRLHARAVVSHGNDDRLHGGPRAVRRSGLTSALYAASAVHERAGRRARLITNGRFEVGDERGAREITEVSGALNDAIRNLEQLKTQAEALGTGDLGNPVSGQPTPGRSGELLFASVVAGHEAQRELSHRATHDQLTGLLNRGVANEQLGAALAAANARGTASA